MSGSSPKVLETSKKAMSGFSLKVLESSKSWEKKVWLVCGSFEFFSEVFGEGKKWSEIVNDSSQENLPVPKN